MKGTGRDKYSSEADPKSVLRLASGSEGYLSSHGCGFAEGSGTNAVCRIQHTPEKHAFAPEPHVSSAKKPNPKLHSSHLVWGLGLFGICFVIAG